ncbi:fumarylacetoacetase [Ferrimonas balearica]|uniref:fumarylacetoacetase n=1 Tax=Ferrimonas balearica TaxID=44012 RepID=UPI001C99F1E9|nr:fumarylacetoacetase [Ferrimonas balearica]MBY5992712.1 fumarylacetoacetase [Ferrimonas balearica]
MHQLNETHDTALTSWVESANQAGCDFPIQNLPFASVRRAGTSEPFRGAVAIGDHALDLAAVNAAGVFDGVVAEWLALAAQPKLNAFMAQGQEAWSALRLALSRALRTGAAEQAALSSCLIPLAELEYDLAMTIGDYTDFYTSIHHATAVGSLFRPDNPLLPNYKWVPIGYHGRASSIGVSGQQFHRPKGQLKAPDAAEPSFGPCKRLDYELEVGIVIGQGNALGEAIDIEAAERHVFGLCLLNDWSARDIQAWEYQPLGPFLSKSFASTLSPWIVTLEALAPYRAPFQRPEADPQPLPYLTGAANSAQGAVDMQLECLIQTPTMDAPVRLSRSNFRDSYWTLGQMVTHHSVNGCNLNAGDLFGSGTQSGPAPEEAGSLLELTRGGKQPLTLPGGETRTFLEDGDTIIMRAVCEKPGAPRIGFGEVRSTLLPAR